MESQNNKSLLNLAIKSTMWLFLSRIFLFAINFLRRIILLRLLVARDFGVLAIALLTIEIIETLSDTGIQSALIPKKGDIAPYLDSVWTVNIIRSLVIYTVSFLVAPLFSSFFDSPESVPIIRVLSCVVIISAFSNIGTIYFRKDLTFKYSVILDLIASILGLIALLFYLLLISRSIWALVWARIVASITRCCFSYFIHPYRPRLAMQVDKIKELWSYGKHIWGASILRYICLHGDDILLGKIAGAVVLGYYRQAFEIGNMIANEFANKISQVSFPLYSKVQSGTGKIKWGYLKIFSLTALVIFPSSGILFVFTDEIISYLFGQRWLPIVPALKIFCFLGPFKCMQREPVFLSLGRSDIARKIQQWRFVLMAILVPPLTLKWQMVGTASSLLIVAVFMQFYSHLQFKKLIDIKTNEFLVALLPPLLLTIMTMTLLFSIKVKIGHVSLFTLIVLVFIGMALFLISNYALSIIYKKHKVFSYMREIMEGFKS